VTATQRFAIPPSTRKEDIARVCAMVEQAPYCPRKGIPRLLSPKVEEMH